MYVEISPKMQIFSVVSETLITREQKEYTSTQTNPKRKKEKKKNKEKKRREKRREEKRIEEKRKNVKRKLCTTTFFPVTPENILFRDSSD
jgi:hypothetical protein